MQSERKDGDYTLEYVESAHWSEVTMPAETVFIVLSGYYDLHRIIFSRL